MWDGDRPCRGGTFCYMDPYLPDLAARARNDPTKFNVGVDMYSLGIVMYCLLCNCDVQKLDEPATNSDKVGDEVTTQYIRTHIHDQCQLVPKRENDGSLLAYADRFIAFWQDVFTPTCPWNVPLLQLEADGTIAFKRPNSVSPTGECILSESARELLGWMICYDPENRCPTCATALTHKWFGDAEGTDAALLTDEEFTVLLNKLERDSTSSASVM